ncbi:MAG: hypothetical protein F6K62_12005 [Sphaerospermopsis sp. SIO1G2]|nr:hypothetical protein [Sphaerospermopsis sp. SIO1G2]
MKTTLRFILLTAIRDRLFPVLLLLLLVLIGVSFALSKTLMLEAHYAHLSMSAGLGRIVLNMGIAIFVCFHVRALYDNKEIDVMISRPLSRPQLVFSFWAGFAAVASLLVLALTGMVALQGGIGSASLVLWGGSLLLESWVVVAIALFASLTNKSAVTSVLISFVFYVMGRLMAFFVATANARITPDHGIIGQAMTYIVEFIAIFLPRLDMYAPSEWIVYGVTDMQDALYFAAQSLIFIPLLLFIAIIDFCKKEF